MIPENIIRFVRENPTAFVATVDNGKPRVRAMLVFSCNEREIIFVAGRGKEVCAELERNPQVELCFYSQNETKTLRIEAAAEFFADKGLDEQILEKWPIAEMYAKKPERPSFVTFRIRCGKASFWSLETSANEAAPVEF